jgi:hypothetical protein
MSPRRLIALFAFALLLAQAALASVTIITTAVSNGTVGKPYISVVTADAGCKPYTWAWSTLPAGLNTSIETGHGFVDLWLSGVPTAAGTYTFTVSVTGCQNHRSSKTYTMTIAPNGTQTVGIAISPSTATINTNATEQFAASVSGTTNTGVTWTATGGTVSASGLYTAPNTAGTYSVRATSQADTTKHATATITVQAVQQVGITISPTTASINTNATAQFWTSITGTTNTGCTWTASGGWVSATGLYTAPSSAGTYTVRVASQADPTKSATATVTVQAAQIVGITISPTTATINTNASEQFSASISGTSNTAVTWTASGGTVNASGLYTAPSSAGAYTVTATSQADPTKSVTATMTVQAVQVVGVSVSPTSASIYVDGTEQFAASVTGTSNTAVTWSASGGTVSTSGLYTAPNTAGTYTVKAKSQADTTKTASATVIVNAAIQHQVTLSWNYTENVTDFTVLRANGACGGGGFALLGERAALSYVDSTVVSGQTYCYTTTATYDGETSGGSNQVTVVVPYP